MNLKTYSRAQRGRASELARSIGVPSALVSQWANGIRPVPSSRCPAIERATDGLVRCEDLRPDVDWAYLRGTVPALDVSPDATTGEATTTAHECAGETRPEKEVER
jgi:DNA-binding transcriptional regulator YdaS (Cro superfamily)